MNESSDLNLNVMTGDIQEEKLNDQSFTTEQMNFTLSNRSNIFIHMYILFLFIFKLW